MKTNLLILIFFLIFLFSGIRISATGISLAPKLDSIQVYFDDQQLVLPGESFRIGIISYYRPTSAFDKAPGSHGYHGQAGHDGDFGADGPEIGVWTDLYRDSVLNCDLLYVYAENLSTGAEYRYLINPDGGKLEVSSNGGSGGYGGSGGNGGSGGEGLEGEKWIEKHIEKQIVKKPVSKKVIRKEKKKRTDAEGKEYEVEVDVEVTETVYVDEEIEVGAVVKSRFSQPKSF